MVKELQIWIDFMCPWCLIGVKRIQSVTGQTALPDVLWRAYELRPDAPPTSHLSLRQVMVSRRGIADEQTDRIFAVVESNSTVSTP